MNAASAKGISGAKLLIAFALVATVCVPIFLGGTETFGALLHFPSAGYIAIVALVVLNWLARTLKLQIILRRLLVHAPFTRVLGVSLAADFGFMVTPAGIGGYAASVYFLRRIGASTSSAAAITAADQLLDAIFFVLAVPVAGVSLSWSIMPRMTSIGLSMALIVCLALSIVWMVWRTYRLALDGSRRCPQRLRQAAFALRDFARRSRTDAQLLLAGGSFFAACICTLTALQQIGRYGVLWTIFAVLGYHLSFALVFVLQTLVVQAASWTGIPSGGGAAEIGLSASFSEWISGSSMAAALLIWRMATLYLGLIAGAAAIAWLSSAAPQATSTDSLLD